MGRQPKLTSVQIKNLGKKLDRKSRQLSKKYPRDLKTQAYEFSKFFEMEQRKSIANRKRTLAKER